MNGPTSHAAAQASHLQRQLHIELARGVAPAGAEQLTDPLQALGDGVGVDVQTLRRLAQRTS